MRQPEVLALLAVSRTTLLAMEDRGEIVPFKLPSGHRRYRRSEVEALIDTNTAPTAERSPRSRPHSGGGSPSSSDAA